MTMDPEKPVFDDWTEYKRLVLSELERLNSSVDKLKDKCVEIQNYVQSEINSTRESLHIKINIIDKEYPSLIHKIDSNRVIIDSFKAEIDALEKVFATYKKEQEVDSTISNKWGFWAAVISIIGSLIVSIISLIVAIY